MNISYLFDENQYKENKSRAEYHQKNSSSLDLISKKLFGLQRRN